MASSARVTRTFVRGAALAAAVAGCGPLELEGLEQVPARCSATPRAAAHVRGAGASALDGALADVEGVVTLARAEGEPPGFYLQPELSGAPGPRGWFVELPDGAAVPAPGERVRARGRVTERRGSTVLADVEALEQCGFAPVAPLPLETLALENAEPWENAWVRSRDTWTLLEPPSASDRELRVGARGRRYAAFHPLGTGAEANTSDVWTLDAARGDAVAQLRAGATLRDLEAVVQPDARRLLATRAHAWHVERPGPPPARSPELLRVAAFNLENYGVAEASPRADDPSRERLLAALRALDADVLAVAELANTVPNALDALLSALNAGLAPVAHYASSGGAAPESFVRNALLYRPARVTPLGDASFLEPDVFRRAPALQRFGFRGGEVVVVAVHLKSKLCGDEPQTVGAEGCGADTRLDEARALSRSWTERAPPEPWLIAGDFNSDVLEAPLGELRRSGFVDLLDSVEANERYSYVFDGRASQLDHVLARAELGAAVRRAGIWHINADEPRSMRSTPPGAALPEVFGSSDHDPVFVDLDLGVLDTSSAGR